MATKYSLVEWTGLGGGGRKTNKRAAFLTPCCLGSRSNCCLFGSQGNKVRNGKKERFPPPLRPSSLPSLFPSSLPPSFLPVDLGSGPDPRRPVSTVSGLDSCKKRVGLRAPLSKRATQRCRAWSGHDAKPAADEVQSTIRHDDTVNRQKTKHASVHYYYCYCYYSYYYYYGTKYMAPSIRKRTSRLMRGRGPVLARLGLRRERCGWPWGLELSLTMTGMTGTHVAEWKHP